MADRYCFMNMILFGSEGQHLSVAVLLGELQALVPVSSQAAGARGAERYQAP